MLNKKFWLRWAGIFLVFISYYLIQLYFDFVFSLYLSTKMNEPSDNKISSSICDAIIDGLVVNYNNARFTSYLGFMICVPLILIIYKKVR
jgi:hypothetical protein